MLQRSLIALKGGETDRRHAATQVCVGTVSDDEPESREATGEGSALDGTRSPWSTAQSKLSFRTDTWERRRGRNGGRFQEVPVESQTPIPDHR